MTSQNNTTIVQGSTNANISTSGGSGVAVTPPQVTATGSLQPETNRTGAKTLTKTEPVVSLESLQNSNSSTKVDMNVHQELMEEVKTEETQTPQGVLGSFKAKWKNHVDKNKKNAAKNKKGATANAAGKVDKPIDELDDLFENYDPKKDRKKLTPELRKKIVAAEKFYQEGTVNVKDLISPSSFEVSPRTLRLNNSHVKTYYVYNYPRYLDTNWLNQLINFDATFDLSLFVYPTDSARMMRILRKKVTQMRASAHMKSSKGITNDTALDTALEDAEQLRVDLQRGKERFFQVGVYFSVYAESSEKLELITKQLETILGGLLVLTRPAEFQTERGFNSTLPQCTDDLDIVRNMNTGPLSTTFPFVSSSLTSNEGILYGLNRHNNSLIIFDRFKLENANAVIFAKSGAGKSYAVKLEVLRSLMMNTDVIILDPEKEYETLTHTIGGSYINISLNSPHRINPFDLPKALDPETDNTATLLRESVITLSGLMNLMLGKLTPEESSLMDKALYQTYAIKGITAELEDPTQYQMPTMVDLHNVLVSMQGAKSMAMRLEKYTTGTFAGLFSQQTNVDLSSGLLCFGIRDLEDQLRPISMHILLNFIWNRVRSQMKRRMLVIDEAWNIVQHEDSGRFLHNLCKRARKYYLGITTITQDVEDFMHSPWGKPIITNSSMQLLLKQAPSAMELLKPVFNLTEQEKYLLLNSGVGQGLFFAGNQHVAIQIIASYGEDKIVTTNPQELLDQQK